MASATGLGEDPELHLERKPTDLHSLRASDGVLDKFSDHIQRYAADSAVASLQRDDGDRTGSLRGQRILVTGSAGYLGKAFCLALRGLGAVPIGLDIVAGENVDFEGDVSDSGKVREAMKGCNGVLHTAALHAPHAAHHHESAFIATNITGTQNVLDAAVEAGGIPVIHTSTTSLTITKNVKKSEKSGKIVWLDANSQSPMLSVKEMSDPADAPRNKYGRTKLEGERRCVAAAQAGLPCVIIRISRCFPEDLLADSVIPGETPPDTANLKANELLGRRVALVDVVTGHLRALTRASEPAIIGKVLTLSAPFPFTRSETPTESAEFAGFLKEHRPDLLGLYKKLGWSMPFHLGRVYDAKLAVQLLDWRPLITFDLLIEALSGGDVVAINGEDARLGRY